MTTIIDFHTHAFPDHLAKSAIPFLEEEGNVQAFLDGRVVSLLGSMDEAGVDKSVVCSIATKPSQFLPIIEWSAAIRSERILPFPSIHPESPNWPEELDRIKEAGFKGIKMHPYYQHFFLDEPRMMPIYEKLSALNLILVMHCGFDIAFPHSRRATPPQIKEIITAFPDLKFIATHLGSWQLWDEVEQHLNGLNVYLDVSFSFDYLSEEQARRILQTHSPQFLLFGTDSPWDNQARCIRQLKDFKLGSGIENLILGENALALLGQ